MGIEPTTQSLDAICSTVELSANPPRRAIALVPVIFRSKECQTPHIFSPCGATSMIFQDKCFSTSTHQNADQLLPCGAQTEQLPVSNILRIPSLCPKALGSWLRYRNHPLRGMIWIDQLSLQIYLMGWWKPLLCQRLRVAPTLR